MLRPIYFEDSHRIVGLSCLKRVIQDEWFQQGCPIVQISLKLVSAQLATSWCACLLEACFDHDPKRKTNRKQIANWSSGSVKHKCEKSGFGGAAMITTALRACLLFLGRGPCEALNSCGVWSFKGMSPIKPRSMSDFTFWNLLKPLPRGQVT